MIADHVHVSQIWLLTFAIAGFGAYFLHKITYWESIFRAAVASSISLLIWCASVDIRTSTCSPALGAVAEFMGYSVLLLSVIGMKPIETKETSVKPSRLSFPALVVALLFASYFATALYFVYSLPIFGWDVFETYVPGVWFEPGYAKLSLELLLQASEQCDTLYSWSHRHPPFVSAMLASDYFVGDGLLNLKILPWICIAFSGVACVVSTTHMLTKNLILSALSGIVVLTMPLSENHMLIVGYSELLIATYLLIFVSCLFLCTVSYSPSLKIFSLVLSFSSIYIKSSGFIYSIFMLSAILIAEILKYDLRFAKIMTLLLALVWSIFIVIMFNSDGLGNFLILFIDGMTIDFAGRREIINVSNGVSIQKNLVWSFFLNQSFSVAALITLIIQGIFLCDLYKPFLYSSSKINLAVIVVLTSGLFFIFTAFQFSNYGAAVSVPNSDTGFSRFIIPLFSISAFGPYLFHLLINNEVHRKTSQVCS